MNDKVILAIEKMRVKADKATEKVCSNANAGLTTTAAYWEGIASGYRSAALIIERLMKDEP